MRIVFLGPPNSGKGTQAERLSRELGVPSISTGEMLRLAIAEKTELGARVENVMASGELVGDDLMAEIVRARLAKDDTQDGFILDGYPRTMSQAETLDEIFVEADRELDRVLLIDAPEEVLITRALGRGRVDDTEKVLRERLRVYKRKTSPLVGRYERRGLLSRIAGDHSIEGVNGAIREHLGMPVE